MSVSTDAHAEPAREGKDLGQMLMGSTEPRSTLTGEFLNVEPFPGNVHNIKYGVVVEASSARRHYVLHTELQTCQPVIQRELRPCLL
ncbi:hypothetical protein F442_04622 [Phytophthora nicotianae P10297]|uniref:Uncharacterized protein n=1 Tax=Phytophthora nicotianae P10297 TaxID=1317064 RepID=W2ZRP0_PHYNI|nr:hypothetical protein F442_04622 [Phytophthora nicotianae P10297]